MDGLPEWVAVLGLTLLRLGLPIAITLLAGYWLARLDAKWQAEEQQRQEQARAEAEMPARVPCWEVKGCAPETREKCPAYQAAAPCWIALRQADGRMPERCFTCPVFVTA